MSTYLARIQDHNQRVMFNQQLAALYNLWDEQHEERYQKALFPTFVPLEEWIERPENATFKEGLKRHPSPQSSDWAELFWSDMLMAKDGGVLQEQAKWLAWVPTPEWYDYEAKLFNTKFDSTKEQICCGIIQPKHVPCHVCGDA